MRDHKKLRAFELADELVIMVYRFTRGFPKEEVYGLSSQMRRAAISVPSNIVEGCSRTSTAEYKRFLEIAFGSLRELYYQYSIAIRLGYIEKDKNEVYNVKFVETEKVLANLLRKTN
ncbi:MAG: four helix bundle protein [Bacteroidota bacterium]